MGGLEADARDADVLDVLVVVFARLGWVGIGDTQMVEKRVVLRVAVVVDLDLSQVGVVYFTHGAELGDCVEDHGCGGAGGHVVDVEGAITVRGQSQGGYSKRGGGEGTN